MKFENIENLLNRIENRIDHPLCWEEYHTIIKDILRKNIINHPTTSSCEPPMKAYDVKFTNLKMPKIKEKPSKKKLMPEVMVNYPIESL